VRDKREFSQRKETSTLSHSRLKMQQDIWSLKQICWATMMSSLSAVGSTHPWEPSGESVPS